MTRMNQFAQFEKIKLHKEAIVLLLEGSLTSISFNTLLAFLLSVDLIYNQAPVFKVASWFLAILLISILRWVYSKLSLKDKRYEINPRSFLLVFVTLTFLMGLAWGACYFLFIPYVSRIHEIIIILVLGGMAAGSIPSLSIYLPAYYAYILPIFLPVIFYNFYQVDVERVILGTMFLLFVIMLIVIGNINAHLLDNTFKLSKEKDYLISQLRYSNKRLEEYIQKLKIVSITDSLTGLYNRRYFDKTLKNEFNRAKRNKYPLVLILIDIDNFKELNDNYGHPYGDEFLIYVAHLLANSIKRSNDTVFRIGGDEFAAVLANISIDDAVALCQSIREQYNKEVTHEGVSLSIGLVHIPHDYTGEIENAVIAADKALYEAKRNGKNKLVSRKL